MLLQITLFHFFFMTEYHPIVCVGHFYIHSSVDGHLVCFHGLTIVNSAAMQIWGACIFLHYVLPR